MRLMRDDRQKLSDVDAGEREARAGNSANVFLYALIALVLAYATGLIAFAVVNGPLS